jgi:hypothetical protein
MGREGGIIYNVEGREREKKKIIELQSETYEVHEREEERVKKRVDIDKKRHR